MKRSNRAEVAKDTLRILDQGYYINEAGQRISIGDAQRFALENTRLYSPTELADLTTQTDGGESDFGTVFEVVNDTTLNVVRRLLAEGKGRVLYLNFASARNPGGGFQEGSQAQEESIARATGLYPCLRQARRYYEINRQVESRLYTDHMIYSPEVPILKDEEGNMLDRFLTASVITAPAVNAGVVRQEEPGRSEEIEPTMRRRIDYVLSIAKAHHHPYLVLGAWGCGVCQNEPKAIARYFADALSGKYAGNFRQVTFAIFDKSGNIISPFQELFGRSIGR